MTVEIAVGTRESSGTAGGEEERTSTPPVESESTVSGPLRVGGGGACDMMRLKIMDPNVRKLRSSPELILICRRTATMSAMPPRFT